MPTGKYKHKKKNSLDQWPTVWKEECMNCGNWHRESDIKCPKCGLVSMERAIAKKIKDRYK